MNKEFIGKKYIEDSKRESLLKSYDSYQINKLNFINEVYSSLNTQVSTWILYDKNIHYDELNKGKDLMHYTGQEIENLVASKVAYSEQTRSNIMVMINKYMEWNMYKGNILINPCQEINVGKLKKGNVKLLKKKLLSLKEFWDMIEDIDKITDMSNYMPLILARYGIVGKELSWMINLKWDDILTIENKKYAQIYKDDKLTAQLPLDNKIVKAINMYKDHEYSLYNKKEGEDRKGVELIDNGYVLKKSASSTSEGLTETYNTIFGKVTRCLSYVGKKRIPFNDLVKSRKIDILLSLRMNNKLTTYDVENVNNMFSFDKTSVNGTVKLKKLWEELTGEKVLPKTAKQSQIEDSNSVAFVENICKELNINIEEIREI